MTLSLGLLIEGLVAFLLVLTIGYCVVLNWRLKRLRADEEALRATISELITATEIAERAIMGLKATASHCDLTLAQRLQEAERYSNHIANQINTGEAVLKRIAQIAAATKQAGRSAGPSTPQLNGSAPSAKGLTVAAAEAADRLRELRRRGEERAA
jgi:hypothetical protein